MSFAPFSKARSSLASVVALAATLACHPSRIPPSDRALAARARLIRLEDTRADEPPFLDSLLNSGEPALRRAAAFTVGRIAARSHLPALRRLALEPDPMIADAAFYSLGLLADSASATHAAARLRVGDGAASSAAWLLGQIGEAGRSGLIATIGDANASSRARGAALLALARIKPATVGPLLPLLANGDTAIAWRAAYALARGRSASAVRALIGASTSPTAIVRDQAARGLARSLAADSLGTMAQAALRRLAADSSARVRVSALRVLAAYGAANGPVFANALRDPDPNVRITAAASAELACDTSTTKWNAAWRADTGFTYRRTLAESGQRRGALLSAWNDWRRDTRWEYRAAAAELDGHASPRAALARLDEAMRDTDGRVRAAAATALAAFADSAAVSADVRTRLRSSLTDDDFEVRAASLGALAKGASIEELRAGTHSYLTHQSDRDTDARLAFWSLADSALRRVSNALPDSVERMLSAIVRPSDPLERVAAANIPRFAAWRDSTGTVRDAGWYQARAREAMSARAPVARIETDRGVLELELFAADAPVTVNNFAVLARRGYFDGQRFHRVVPNFVIQAGDPRGDGNGGPGYAIRDELNPHRYDRGTLGMALSGPNTGGSQFFVTHSPQPHLDGGYTVFGQLRSGGDVLDRIVQGDRIVRVSIH